VAVALGASSAVAIVIFGVSSAISVAKIATAICGASSAIACHRERLRV
jgi:hypothetical protein